MQSLHLLILLLLFLFIFSGCSENPQTFGEPPFQLLEPDPSFTYFLVSEFLRDVSDRHNDSYILPLKEAEHINHARDLIADPVIVGSTIVFAKIDTGNGKHNRDLLSSEGRVWSWHVTEFLGFGPASKEIHDSAPHLIENNPTGFINSLARGTIAFWNYTITNELTLNEVKTGLLKN